MTSVLAARGRLIVAGFLGAPAAAFGAAELLAVAAGRAGDAVPTGVHTYLPLISRTGRGPLMAGSLLLALAAICLLRGTAGVARTGLAIGAAAAGQLVFMAMEVILVGGLEDLPDAPSALGTAVLLQILLAVVGLLLAAVVRSTLRLLLAGRSECLAGTAAAAQCSLPDPRPSYGRGVRIPHRRGPPTLLLHRS